MTNEELLFTLSIHFRQKSVEKKEKDQLGILLGLISSAISSTISSSVQYLLEGGSTGSYSQTVTSNQAWDIVWFSKSKIYEK